MVFNACPQTAPDGRGFCFNLFSFHLEFSLVICYGLEILQILLTNVSVVFCALENRSCLK